MIKTQHLEDVHTAVHTGDDGEVALRRQCQPGIGEVLHETGVIKDKFVCVGGKVGGGRHGYILPEQVAFLHI